jgi:ATP-binding cassette, subfamily B, bacterial HlyB/CyaB
MRDMPHMLTGEIGQDAGLECLVVIARLHGLAADMEQLRYDFSRSDKPLDAGELVRVTLYIGLKARVQSNWGQSQHTPLQAIACCKDKDFLAIARLVDGRVLVHDPLKPQPQLSPEVHFETRRTGLLVMLTRRAPAGTGESNFGTRWFIPSIIRYRALFAEALIASIFLKSMMLVTPILRQRLQEKFVCEDGRQGQILRAGGYYAAMPVRRIAVTGLAVPENT